MQYNNEQLKIIKSNDKHIFINAGAGTGKTTTILGRIKELLDRGVKEEDILALSFTRKAANVLTERIESKKITSATFHSLIYNFLLEQGLNKKIFESSEANPFTKEDLNHISKYKNKQTRIKPFIYLEYQNYLEENNLIDYDDMLLVFLKGNYSLKYKYIFVDEFQDTNNLQYEVLKKLTTPETNIFCVGDPNQAIYAFRGSNHKIITKFIKEYNAKVYPLRINYRSRKNIITFANRFIRPLLFRGNFKNLISNTNKNGLIKLRSFKSDEEEATEIINYIKLFLQKGYKKKDIAIIAREEARLYTLQRSLDDTYLSVSNPNNEINFMTIHKVKGLEFKVVFILGLESGLFPSKKTNSYTVYQEERRLFYVAITRAKTNLIITRAKLINKTYKIPSKFYIESLFKLRGLT